MMCSPLAGLKITDGPVEEAYGGTPEGVVISSDGDYMVCIGKCLTAMGLTKRYPLLNETNFTSDGRVHVYKWGPPTWGEILNVERFIAECGIGGHSDR
jgi:hypothetical protein